MWEIFRWLIVFLMGIGVVLALDAWRRRMARQEALRRARDEKLKESDPDFLAACGLAIDDPQAPVGLALRRIIVDTCGGADPPVRWDDPIQLDRLTCARLLFEDSFDPMDFWFRLER